MTKALDHCLLMVIRNMLSIPVLDGHLAKGGKRALPGSG
jgi:hypothetical protein